MKRWSLMAIAVVACLASTAALASTKERYIVVFKPGAELSAAEEHGFGGEVHHRLNGRIVISVPEAAIEALSSHPKVKYIQKSVAYEEGAIPQVIADSSAAGAIHTPADQSLTTWTSGDYVYDGVGNIAAIGTSTALGTGNRRATYRYDGVSRLRSSSTTTDAETVAETFGYDVYGNMTTTTYQGTSTTIRTVAAKNQLAAGAGAAYDQAGNLTQHGSEQYVWDAANTMITRYDALGTPEVYVYTADDERIGVRNGNEWVWSIRGLDGKVLRQYKGTTVYAADWLWLRDYAYRGSQLLGSERVAAEGGRRHFHLDHLGSARVITNSLRQVTSRHDYRPFGVESTSMNQDVAEGIDGEEPMDFTGHERDFTGGTSTNNENYLDYMHARYYLPKWGRFLSVDPSTKYDLQHPQTWNRYAYAHNNPLLKVDPDGRDALAVTYVGYRVQTPFGRRPLGHSGITIIQGSGRTSYYEFGRYRPGGEVRRLGVPDLVMKNGLPTRDSLKAHMAALSAKAGQGLPVSGAYFTNDTAPQMQAFAEERKQDSSKQGTYGLLTNNCATFCEDVLRAGGEKLDVALKNTPENVMEELQDRADFTVHYDPKKDELTVTCREGAACPP